MELSIFIRFPLLFIPIFFMFKHKNYLVSLISKIRLPKILVALLISVPLIVYEEHLNCGAYGCTSVILPPTLWFLLIIESLFLFIIKFFSINKVFYQLIFLSFYGVLFEFFLGGSKDLFQDLFMENFFIFSFIALWVSLSYIFIFFIPFSVVSSD